MGTIPSPIQNFSIPDSNTKIAETRFAIEKLVKEIEKTVVMVFDTSAQMAQRVPVPTEGMVAWVKDANVLYVHTGSAWAQVYPVTPRIYSGSALPDSSLGNNGDIYFRG